MGPHLRDATPAALAAIGNPTWRAGVFVFWGAILVAPAGRSECIDCPRDQLSGVLARPANLSLGAAFRKIRQGPVEGQGRRFPQKAHVLGTMGPIASSA
jgi:hypothetical protein